MNITCGDCHYTGYLEAFTRNQPANHFRCPACERHWKIEAAPSTVYPSGFVMPGKRTIVVLGEGKAA